MIQTVDKSAFRLNRIISSWIVQEQSHGDTESKTRQFEDPAQYILDRLLEGYCEECKILIRKGAKGHFLPSKLVKHIFSKKLCQVTVIDNLVISVVVFQTRHLFLFPPLLFRSYGPHPRHHMLGIVIDAFLLTRPVIQQKSPIRIPLAGYLLSPESLWHSPRSHAPY